MGFLHDGSEKSVLSHPVALVVKNVVLNVSNAALDVGSYVDISDGSTDDTNAVLTRTASANAVTSLGADAVAFNANDALVVLRNGIELEKGGITGSVIWMSATRVTFTESLSIGDRLVFRESEVQ